MEWKSNWLGINFLVDRAKGSQRWNSVSAWHDDMSALCRKTSENHLCFFGILIAACFWPPVAQTRSVVRPEQTMGCLNLFDGSLWWSDALCSKIRSMAIHTTSRIHTSGEFWGYGFIHVPDPRCITIPLFEIWRHLLYQRHASYLFAVPFACKWCLSCNTSFPQICGTESQTEQLAMY